MLKDISIHRNYLVQIIKDIYSNPEISSLFGFKGGTAAYFLYNLDRFSVDLDFDLLESEKSIPVMNKLENILIKYGDIKEKYNKKNTIFLMVSYDANTRNIKIEINKRNFGSTYELKNFLGISLQAMIKEDMFSHKLAALYEREGKSNRDIYDINFFLKSNWKFNKEIIRTRMKMEPSVFLNKCINIINKKSSRNILTGIGELFSDTRKDWVKKNLIPDTLYLLKNYIQTIK